MTYLKGKPDRECSMSLLPVKQQVHGATKVLWNAAYGGENRGMRMKAKLPYTIVRAWDQYFLSAKESETQSTPAGAIGCLASRTVFGVKRLRIEENDERRIRQPGKLMSTVRHWGLPTPQPVG